jgi:hypothetical protein
LLGIKPKKDRRNKRYKIQEENKNDNNYEG